MEENCFTVFEWVTDESEEEKEKEKKIEEDEYIDDYVLDEFD